MPKMLDSKWSIYLSIFVLLCIIVSGLAAPLIMPYNPFQPDMSIRLQSPNSEHWLGTDALGRDMLSRMILGSRNTIIISLLCTLIALMVGGIIGMLAGYYGKTADKLYNIFCNIFQGIPGSCLMIAIAGFWGPGIGGLVLAVVISNWTGFSRIIRAEVIRIRQAGYIEGLICLGAGDMRIIFHHILPNLRGIMLVLGTQRLGRSILSIAGLSFLGLGIQPPAPDWSVMINDSMLYYRSAPYLVLIPGCGIFLLVSSINNIGKHLERCFGWHKNEVRPE